MLRGKGRIIFPTALGKGTVYQTGKTPFLRDWNVDLGEREKEKYLRRARKGESVVSMLGASNVICHRGKIKQETKHLNDAIAKRGGALAIQ